MIRWAESKSGLRVPIVNGISLCSLVDPVKEATKWYESYKDILDNENYFVLGLAGGFHIDLLIKNHPQAYITVIENNPELVKGMISKIETWGDRVTVLVSPTIEQIKNYESFHSIFEQGSYCVLRHPIAYNSEKDYFQEMEDFILGRNLSGLEYISNLKSNKNPYFKDFIKNKNLNGSENIKDIIGKIKDDPGANSTEDLIWLSLGELIH